MLNTVYQLKRPRQFDITFKPMSIDCDHIIVRPTHLSICHADQRYYQGLRPQRILSEKLPMALIHEGIGKVVYDPTDTFKIDSKVVMIPNIPMESCNHIAENYLRSSKFRGSSFDGFLQEYVSLEPSRVVSLPMDINDNVATFTEIVSVGYHAISRFEKFSHEVKNTIGVWGDGNLGYITSLLLKKMYPNSKIYVFGVNRLKLNDFTFADETFLVGSIPKGLNVDHAFECVGGGASEDAINQIIDCISPEGTISLMGVSENNVPINTRMVLEKGLRIFGSSRSGRTDFINLIELYRNCPDILLYLENIVGSVITVRSIKDIVFAFETDIHSMIGKTIMVWNK
ncbi:MAG: zinc-binding dehydrogenase [Ruminococcus sp.]|nr:zinc-binding dehydrogenase [Ruminococcus sp.]MCD7800841.1 zinc-binding dehydrogenase [Ruminococcus sp.]